MPYKYASMEDRILANTVVDITLGMRMSTGEWSPCWIWIGSKTINRSGMPYGKIMSRFAKGPRKGQVRTELVHRVVLRVFRGFKMRQRAVGMHLCHTTTLCCHPDHLHSGSQKANVRQCVAEGRHRNAYK